jgi:hypothetical protein
MFKQFPSPKSYTLFQDVNAAPAVKQSGVVYSTRTLVLSVQIYKKEVSFLLP